MTSVQAAGVRWHYRNGRSINWNAVGLPGVKPRVEILLSSALVAADDGIHWRDMLGEGRDAIIFALHYGGEGVPDYVEVGRYVHPTATEVQLRALFGEEMCAAAIPSYRVIARLPLEPTPSR